MHDKSETPVHGTCSPKLQMVTQRLLCQHLCNRAAHRYTYILLPAFCVSDPIAFIDVVGKEEDAEKEEDMKTSKMNGLEARTVVSDTILCTEDQNDVIYDLVEF